MTAQHIAIYAAGLAAGIILWEILRRPRVAKEARIQFAISMPRPRVSQDIPAIIYGGPHDGLQFNASTEADRVHIQDATYRFAACASPGGRWIFRYQPEPIRA